MENDVIGTARRNVARRQEAEKRVSAGVPLEALERAPEGLVAQLALAVLSGECAEDTLKLARAIVSSAGWSSTPWWETSSPLVEMRAAGHRWSVVEAPHTSCGWRVGALLVEAAGRWYMHTFVRWTSAAVQTQLPVHVDVLGALETSLWATPPGRKTEGG